jgi:hypothetical protein
MISPRSAGFWGFFDRTICFDKALTALSKRASALFQRSPGDTDSMRDFMDCVNSFDISVRKLTACTL